MNKPKTQFMRLSPDQQRAYEALIDQMHQIRDNLRPVCAANEDQDAVNATQLLLNAVVATGDGFALMDVSDWGWAIEYMDTHDMVGILHRRPVTFTLGET